jgi:NAD(P)-dependent dehydrogenase (short-subunit alcohol dehydrogenase family)
MVEIVGAQGAPDGSGPGLAWVAGVSASAGLGAAAARRFAKAGLTVALTGRSDERVRKVADEIAAEGGRVLALPGDLTSPAQIGALATRIASEGLLRLAVFNAGSFVTGTPLTLSPEVFEEVWRGNTYAGFLFARATLPLLLPTGGTLLFTGATASLRGRGPFTAIAAAKAGLRSLAQSAAREYGPQGVHVAHIVIDGGIDGQRLRSAAPQRVRDAGADGLLDPDSIAETYWQLHLQHRSAWTHELDLRPYKEVF